MHEYLPRLRDGFDKRTLTFAFREIDREKPRGSGEVSASVLGHEDEILSVTRPMRFVPQRIYAGFPPLYGNDNRFLLAFKPPAIRPVRGTHGTHGLSVETRPGNRHLKFKFFGAAVDFNSSRRRINKRDGFDQ